MSFPDLEFRTSPIRESDAEAILLALPPLDDAADALAEWPGLHGALEAVGFTGARSSYLRVAAPEATRLPLAVVGTGTSPGEQDVRAAVGAGVRSLTGFDTVAVAAPAFEGWRAVAEGATLGGYRFDSYKSTPPPARAATVVVHGETRPDRGELEAVRADAEAMALVKDLSTMPADRLGPADFVQHADGEIGRDRRVRQCGQQVVECFPLGLISGVRSQPALQPGQLTISQVTLSCRLQQVIKLGLVHCRLYLKTKAAKKFCRAVTFFAIRLISNKVSGGF